jgi:hypothetical protein
MRTLRPTILALTLTLMVSSTTAFAGNIGGLRANGNIGGLRTAGNIGGTRMTGNIGGTRSAGIVSTSATLTTNGSSRVDLETAISGTLAGLIRMLLESGALL